MTTRRHIGGAVLAVAALAGFGDGSAQGTGAPDSQGASRRPDTAAALQLQLLESTKRSNELAAEQNKQTKQILEQTNALADASVKQSAAAEQTMQIAEASINRNMQALENIKTVADRTIQTAQSSNAFAEKVFKVWSAVLAVVVAVSGYFGWRAHKNMREKVAQTVDEMRSLGLAELQKVLADLKAEKQLLHDGVARQKEALTKETPRFLNIAALLSIDVSSFASAFSPVVNAGAPANQDPLLIEDLFHRLRVIEGYARELADEGATSWIHGQRALLFYYTGHYRKALEQQVLSCQHIVPHTRFDRQRNLARMASKVLETDEGNDAQKIAADTLLDMEGYVVSRQAQDLLGDADLNAVFAAVPERKRAIEAIAAR